MTGKDKTGDQLVASIRKTKQAATKSKKTSARRTSPASKATPKASKKTAAAPRTTRREKPAVGSYQQGKRVWPD